MEGRPAADRLGAARALLVALVVLGVLAVLVVAVGTPLVAVSGSGSRAVLTRALSQSAPALVPAGQPSRTPASHPAVEAAHAPGLGRLAPASSTLLVPR